MVAYDVYRNKFNKEKSMRAALGDLYKEAWDSWPEKVWKTVNESVVLVQTGIRQEKKQRTQGVMQCVWNNVRAMVGRTPTVEPTAVAVKEEESEGATEPIRRPEFFTGELPHNTIVDVSAFNRPDPSAFAEAVNKPPDGYEEDVGTKRVMPEKAPYAFEWYENKGWNAQARLDQRISLEKNKNSKIWNTPPGQAARTVESELEKLAKVKWTKKAAEDVYTRVAERQRGKLSEREMTIFRWMCFHIYLGGNTTSNPCSTDVFGYFHSATNAQCEFMYEKMKGPGMTGLYASCGFTKYVQELDAYVDEEMSRVTDMDPLLSESYEWCANRRGAFSLRLVWVVSQLMNAYQQHHIDFRAVFALTDREWELWCQQWHMYKRDYAIGITHGVVPASDQRYEVVCLYLEALTRIEIQETQPGKKDAKAWVTFNPGKCTFCSQSYKSYENIANAASAAWNHATSCAEKNLQIKGEGPTFPAGSMTCMDAMSIIEAKMTKLGGLDFETNIEWLFTNLVETAIGSRVDFFESLLVNHSVSEKKTNEEQYGVNIPLLRLIANGQIFNQNFVHPKNDLKDANQENEQCQELLDRWIRATDKVTPWGGLTIVRDNEAFPARNFSFSKNEKIGKVKNYSHPRLHPMRNQKRAGDVWLLVPTTGCLPMGSFCGTYGYGIIHPSLINASVIQMSYASSHPDVPTYGRTPVEATQESDPERAPGTTRAIFDMISVAPNFDLLLEACTAEEVAKTIVRFDMGMLVTKDRSHIMTPGSTGNKKGSPDAMRKEVDNMLMSDRFGIWMASTFGDNVNTPDLRCRARMELGMHPRKDENSLAKLMSRIIPHMGAHMRAYQFLCFQTQIGHRSNEQITLDEVSEVIPVIIQQGWLNPSPRSDYHEYLSGGNLHLLEKGFKGKSRLRALWDITGYALQGGIWTNPPTVEMYLYQMATFWSMRAPKALPTLPGIGGDGVLYQQFESPSVFWNSKYIESLNVKRIVLDEAEDKRTPTTTALTPKAVSKAPVITQQPWDPVLGDSVHAFAWWTLSKDEMVSVINEQKSRSSKRPATQMTESSPASKRTSVPKGSVAKMSTTTSKTGADPPPSKETVKVKTATIIAPTAPLATDLVIPLPELTGPPGPKQSPPIEYRGNAGIREASQVRGKRTSKGYGSRIPLTEKGTPSVPPEEAVGAYRADSPSSSAVAQSQDKGAQAERPSHDRSRSRDPHRESTPAVPIPRPQTVMRVPDYLLPIMATAGVGHLSLEQPQAPIVGGTPPPKASSLSIHEFFESFTQAQDRDEQVRAVQQFAAELLNAPSESGSPAIRNRPDSSRPVTEGGASGRIPSPQAPGNIAAAASRESSSPKEDEQRVTSDIAPTERGRQLSLTERVRSSLHWPSLRSITGSGRRPKSPTRPPRRSVSPTTPSRPKPESVPKRANSMPRLPDPASAESTGGTAPSAVATSPITIVPAVQIPAPVAVEPRTGASSTGSCF